VLPILRPATKAAPEKAMQGHILAQGELVEGAASVAEQKFDIEAMNVS